MSAIHTGLPIAAIVAEASPPGAAAVAAPIDRYLEDVLDALTVAVAADLAALVTVERERPVVLAQRGTLPVRSIDWEALADDRRTRLGSRDAVGTVICLGRGSGKGLLAIPAGDGFPAATWLILGRHAAAPDARPPLNLAVDTVRPLLELLLRDWPKLRAERERADGLTAVLNHGEVGVVILGRDKQVQFANDASRMLLGAADGVRVAHGTVVATTLQDGIKLHTAIDHAVSSPLGETGVPVEILLLLRRPEGRRPLVAGVVALAGSDGHVRTPIGALLYLLRPEQSHSRMLGPICRLHGLSPAEGRLVTQLVSGSTITDAARALGIKAETARAYLKQVFAKTDTHRQTDLICLMLRQLLPLNGNSVPHVV